MSNGIYIILAMAAVAVVFLIRGAISMHRASKLQDALSELHEMELDAWEEKWADYIQEEYNKVDDPHREEVESDMEFFRKCREELKEGDEQ